jgi:hypothetical protein
MDYSMMPDQTDAETARLGRQNTQLGDAMDQQKQMALIQALRKYGGSAGGQQGDGRMVGKFYVPTPQNKVTDALGAAQGIAGAFGGGGAGGGLGSLFGQ